MVRRLETRSVIMTAFRVLFYIAVLAVAAVCLPADEQTQVTSFDQVTSQVQ
jgi:hypothetical protein